MIKVKNFSKKYKNRILFEDFSLEFGKNGLYSIVGDSGCGKSTLLNCLSGLDMNFDGEIYIENKNLKLLNNDQLLDLRKNKFGYVFQSFNLFENETVFNNIKLVSQVKSKDIECIVNNKINDVLKKLNIYEIKDEFVKYLSGGEKQRVAIARAVINEPDIIFCDEPTGSLDDKNSDEIFQILQELSSSSLVILVTHDEVRAKHYSNFLLDLTTKDFFKIKNPQKIINVRSKSPVSSKINFKHILSNINHCVKSRKSRYLISNFIFSLSLICLGLTIYVSNNISEGIGKAFSTLISDKTLILKKKNQTNDLKLSALNEEKVNNLCKKYKNDISYLGTKFLFNYKEFFPEKRNFYIEQNSILKGLFDLNVSHINNFIFLEDSIINKEKFYPDFSNYLNNDEIILSMNYKNMEDLCLLLKIPRTFNDLGNYLKENPLKIILKTSNSNWNYEDEQVFYLKSVFLNPNLKIYHTNNLFNQKVFKDFMHFKTSYDIYSRHELPWIMNQVYYFKTKTFQTKLIQKIEEDEVYKNIIIESDNETFSPDICKENEICHTNKIYLFSSLNDAFKKSIIKDIKKINPKFNDYYYSTPGGYMNYGGTLFNGFAKEMYFSLNREKLELIENSLQKIKIKDYKSAEFKDNVARGYALDTNKDNVKFSIKFDGKYTGSKDFSVENIAVSTALASRLGKENIIGEDIYLMLNYETKSDEEVYYKKFKIVKFKVIGTVDSNNFKIYNNRYFSISLFRDAFGVSALDLLPDSIIYEFDYKPTQKEINIVNEKIEDYKIIDPFEDINKNMDDVLKYFDYGLILFTIFTSISSLILMFVVNTINFEDDKKEIAIYQMLGFNNHEINKTQLFKNFSYTLPSLISSIFSLIFISFFVSKLINSEIGLDIGFQIPYFAILGVSVLCIIMTLISFFVAICYVKRVKTTEELHKMT